MPQRFFSTILVSTGTLLEVPCALFLPHTLYKRSMILCLSQRLSALLRLFPQTKVSTECPLAVINRHQTLRRFPMFVSRGLQAIKAS